MLNKITPVIYEFNEQDDNITILDGQTPRYATRAKVVERHGDYQIWSWVGTNKSARVMLVKLLPASGENMRAQRMYWMAVSVHGAKEDYEEYLAVLRSNIPSEEDLTGGHN